LMNVRFSDHAIRCRATAAELQQLLTGRAIELEICLPRDRRFLVNVRPCHLTWLNRPTAYIREPHCTSCLTCSTSGVTGGKAGVPRAGRRLYTARISFSFAWPISSARRM